VDQFVEDAHNKDKDAEAAANKAAAKP